ncbi:MAG: tRNA (adenosine(37)-N6)-threonylcarbamoyltransferase complex dimerization subunit type 1 TsaB [Candidatus Eisenbacteria bacterium]|uniref:tRNA (Adenosine(37)-N6)-threonylcarbamoyltransferase complex dimerization subunit type 1 TsaB n=1 Tax=Eiseniibacteriota bacterium TaxID=2212470 RepID=A0A956M155_UNCEI|nr:tRNA (adenosine(37)-N6)-threonylcarbamoyltransferase complex dimerization subunit type 1 TsaB [Candidatus Eisenbacteria bacterium]
MSGHPSNVAPGFVLGLETTGRLTGAALVHDGALVAESAIAARASSQEWLLGLVHELLGRQGLAMSDVTRVAVSIGPGSFTGIRVGLAAARALAWGSGRALVPVPTHQALALPWRGQDAPITLLTSLRRGRVNVEGGRWRDGIWSPWIPAQAVPIERVPEMLADIEADSVFVGEAVAAMLEAVPELARLGRPHVDPSSWTRRPAPVATLGAVLEPVSGEDLDHVDALYLRDADAQKPRQSRER